MKWNYRVIKTSIDLCIFDVYYDNDDRPVATHDCPSYVYGNTLEDLAKHLEYMKLALSKPILDERDIYKVDKIEDFDSLSTPRNARGNSEHSDLLE